MPDDFKRAVEAIKLRAPIEDVVRERVPALKKRGALWVACCPFHQERTPSFTVDPRRGTWHCFGACATGGDQITFLERFDNLSFLDVVDILAARTGVALPQRSTRLEGGDATAPLLDTLEHATRFYAAQLRTTEGQAAVRYMRERGLGDTTIEAFGVGYAPASGQAFVNAMREAQLEFERCEKAGLVRKNEAGRPYDFFRGRLMIPIRDLRGRTIGFGARRLADDDESGPKYVNTAETELFHKGRLVYALDRALPVVRKSGHIVLVEGYTDVMAAHQCGVENVVAVLGTATTDDHAGLIRKTGARRISLVFDGDEAGRKAAYKALHGLLPLEVAIDVVSLPGGDDPCDLLVRSGSGAFLAQIEMAISWFDFLVAGLAGLRGAELSREVDRVLELLARLSKPVHRESRIAELAQALDMPASSLRQQAVNQQAVQRRGSSQRAPASAVDPRAAAIQDRELVECFEALLGAVLLDPSLMRGAEVYFDGTEHPVAMSPDAESPDAVWPDAVCPDAVCPDAVCPDAELRHVFDAIARLYENEGLEITPGSVMTELGMDSARNRVASLVASTEVESAKMLFDGAANRLELRKSRAELDRITASWADLDRRQLQGEDRGELETAQRELAERQQITQQRIAHLASSTPVLNHIRPQHNRPQVNHHG